MNNNKTKAVDFLRDFLGISEKEASPKNVHWVKCVKALIEYEKINKKK